jgi:hypothetical protein
MVSHMTMSYGLQVAQMNEELPQKSSLDLTITQPLRDEDLEPQKVHLHFKIESSQVWYYQFFLNFRTLVILLQVDFAFGDELEIVYKCFYET